MVHSLLLWLAHAESRRYTVNMDDPSVQPSILQEHRNTLKVSARNRLLTWDEPKPEQHQLTHLLRLFKHWYYLWCSELLYCSPWWQDLAEELQGRQKQVSSLQEIVSELLPEAAGEDSAEAREKLHVIGSKLRLLSRQVEQDLQMIQERLVRVFFKVFLRHLQHRVKKRRLIPLRTHCIFFF